MEDAQTGSQDLSSDDVSQETQEATPQEQQQAEAKKYLPADYEDAVYKVTIDGEEKELTIKELGRLQSLEKASQRRFQEAAAYNKKIEDFVSNAKDPEKALKKLGHDPEKFAEEYLRRRIEEMSMSPEQRKENEERSKFMQEKEEWNQQVETRIREEIDTEMSSAFKASGLPKSPYLAARMAGVMAQSIEQSKNGQGKPLSYEEAAGKVKSWFQNATKETLNQMEPKAILDLLGPELAKKLQTAFVQRIEGGTVPSANSKGSAKAVPSISKNTEKKKFNNWREYQEYIDTL